MIRVDVTLIIDPRRAGVPGYAPEQTAALFVADALAALVEDEEDYRVLAAETISGPGLTLWHDTRSIVYVDHPFMLVGPDSVADDESAGPYVRLRDTFTGYTGPIRNTPERTMPNALQAGVYSDVACAQCKNALTVKDATDGFRLCGYCARERQHIAGRLQSLDDGTPSYVDPDTASVIELSHVVYSPEDGNDRATIKRIHVNGPHRGKGVASALLRVACQEADDRGCILDLEIAAREGADGLDNEQLAAWYARHDFEPTEGRPGWMDRIPQDGA